MDMLELNIWKGDWGLPSVDIECLQVLIIMEGLSEINKLKRFRFPSYNLFYILDTIWIPDGIIDTELCDEYTWKLDFLCRKETEVSKALKVYSKFNDVPLKINTSGNPFKTPHGRLPLLRSSSGTFDTAKDIIAYLRERKYNAEYELSRNNCGKIMAYDALLKEKLFPAIQFSWWIDEKNVNELIRPWYCKALNFPLNLYYPGKFERQARTMFEALYPTEDDMTVIENQVYSEAQQCLTLLSTSLGESEYFLGQKPTILDAIIYSYLAPLLKAPLPNKYLQNHLKACTNLVTYVSRISDRYFEAEYREYKKCVESIKKYSDNEFPNKARNQIFAGLLVTLVMAAYILSTGILEKWKLARIPLRHVTR